MRETCDYADDDLVRTKAAGLLIGVSPNTMRKYADDGLVPARRTPGGQRRYRVGDLRDLMPEQREPSDGDARSGRAAAGAA